MEAMPRRLALAALDLVHGDRTDAEIAQSFSDSEQVSLGLSYLLGFLVEALARERREPVPATAMQLRRWLGGPDDGPGVRSPTLPSSPPPAGRVS